MPETVFRVTTRAEGETEQLGARLAGLLRLPCVLALHGDLASGKTALVRGLARGLGFAGEVNSPTFTLVQTYGASPPLHHLDLYRLSHPAELLDLGVEELFEEGLTVIEWAERAAGVLPERRAEITLEHGGRDVRNIGVEDRGVLAAGWREALARTP